MTDQGLVEYVARALARRNNMADYWDTDPQYVAYAAAAIAAISVYESRDPSQRMTHRDGGTDA